MLPKSIGVRGILALLALAGFGEPIVVRASDSHDSSPAAKSVPQEAFLGVRVLKADGAGTLKWSVKLPANCVHCRLILNKATSGQNPREFYFHLIAPAKYDVIHGVHVTMDPAKARSLFVGRSEVKFNRVANGIVFDVPRNGPLISDLNTFHTVPALAPGDVTDQYTYIDTPAVETRVEHADEKRRNGPYAKGPWPGVQRQAALNLEFAARDAIVALGLDKSVRESGIGTILLMGFDTNYPTLTPEYGHEDDPPHWHMHFSWSHDPVIRQVGHLSINAEGLLTDNLVVDIVTNTSYLYKGGQTHETKTDSAQVIYTHTITPEGHFILGTAQGSCRLTPTGTGFQSGVDVACTNNNHRARVRAEDDLNRGLLQVFVNDQLVEEHWYNSDNGMLKASKIVDPDRGSVAALNPADGPRVP